MVLGAAAAASKQADLLERRYCVIDNAINEQMLGRMRAWSEL